MCVSNPDCSPVAIARDVWKRHAKAFFWVRPLAQSPRIAHAWVELNMMLPSDCAKVLLAQSFSDAHLTPWSAFAMRLATWSRRRRARAISKSGEGRNKTQSRHGNKAWWLIVKILFSPALLIIENGLRCRFTQFHLIVYRLDERLLLF